ncbi:copper chaperone PCu(A)C [Marinitenerispora sediminis]|uniref:Copper chaperone PCu(A)C n=1 Tax=Marinitenerispora sediminis TaxID=1931232 RepID=A0A368T278_9ACTN|nr:copper chaperone PCu(A)C [Marinitenerispora sediminis]RCV48216.1 hypothetical protein DEF23_25365 [Marinitenerispora sediminis]RCV48977.1 hypothetical protein DEF28_22135 [Marinitenerispora sediminis]RCV55325.1 hypothetical protein DEF24_18050 [Marinitenerispora sediminis]
MRSPLTVNALAAATAAALLAATGCSGGEAAPQDTPAAAESGAAQAETVTVEDAWIKAATQEEGMTGVFGTIGNPGGEDAAVVAATSPSAGTVELHEVVTGDDGNPVMREKDGGFAVPAEGEHVLEPGADHIMLMELTEDLEPGDEIAIQLEFADGSSTEVTVPVKDYEGANESYEGSGHDAEH